MSGGTLLGLIVLSMAWFFFLAGTAANYEVLRRSRKAKPGEPVPTSFGFVPGVAGSVTVFFTIPALAKFGFEAPWPWLWILLPLVVDPYCLPSLVRGRIRR